MMFAATVEEHVDRHVAPLVDAINRTGRARTYNSCSGHMKDSGFPFVAFKTEGWEFVGTIRQMITEVNEVTGGQTLLEISPFGPDGAVSVVVRFRMYPWLWAPEINLAPLAAQLVFPPPRLVRLWWAELAELATMIQRDEPPGEPFTTHFDRQRRNRRRGLPWWGRRPLFISSGEDHPTVDAPAKRGHVAQLK